MRNKIMVRSARRVRTYRSRHCFPMRPGKAFAITDHFLAPWACTRSMTFASSSAVQGPLTSSGLSTFCHRWRHWTSVRSGKVSAIFFQFLSRGERSQKLEKEGNEKGNADTKAPASSTWRRSPPQLPSASRLLLQSTFDCRTFVWARKGQPATVVEACRQDPPHWLLRLVMDPRWRPPRLLPPRRWLPPKVPCVRRRRMIPSALVLRTEPSIALRAPPSSFGAQRKHSNS